MVAVPMLSTYEPEEGAESRFVLHGVPWATYTTLRDSLDDTNVRMTYLRGTLEFMSSSQLHEESTKLIARLLETWADELDVDLRGFRSTTFRHEAKERGLEPDECYSLGPKEEDAAPHLAIEVVVGSPLVDKLDVYAGLGVREVWVWHPTIHRLDVHVLSGVAYESRTRSTLLPRLDLELVSTFVRPGESHTALAKAYRAALRG